MNEVRLHLVPVRSREAKEFVRTWHRHHAPLAGQIFAAGAADETGTLRAVAIVGGPASLRGAGWRVIATRPPRAGWHTPSRPRTDRITRLLWEAV
ncbi:hypothetical protein [Streptomyces huasconensis]|uniref:hypothetical protein n=1 Tax=Streptomyces huasconensis TaxID=1854574 RepID=UPI00340AD5A2